MRAKEFGFVILGVCLGIGSVLAQGQGSNTRYLPDKPGFWQPLRYLGEHGAGATAAEAQQIDANLKAIQAVLMATPTGTNPVGFYYLPAPMWTSSGRTQPILRGLGIYPLAFVEFRKQGVWTLDMHGETSGKEYSLNNLSEIERVSSKVFEETGPNGAQHPIYTAPTEVGSLSPEEAASPAYFEAVDLRLPSKSALLQIKAFRNQPEIRIDAGHACSFRRLTCFELHGRQTTWH